MRTGRSIARAIIAVLMLAGVAPALAGCEGAEASLTPTARNATARPAIAFAPSHIVFASLARPGGDTAASTPLDLATILSGAHAITRSAERTAAELPALRRAIALCALALFGVGILNAALLGAILHALRDMLRRSAISGATVNVAAAVPRAASPPIATSAASRDTPTCGCGGPVSPRSRSGRCRRCANRDRSAHTVA